MPSPNKLHITRGSTRTPTLTSNRRSRPQPSPKTSSPKSRSKCWMAGGPATTKSTKCCTLGWWAGIRSCSGVCRKHNIGWFWAKVFRFKKWEISSDWWYSKINSLPSPWPLRMLLKISFPTSSSSPRIYIWLPWWNRLSRPPYKWYHLLASSTGDPFSSIGLVLLTASMSLRQLESLTDSQVRPLKI